MGDPGQRRRPTLRASRRESTERLQNDLGENECTFDATLRTMFQEVSLSDSQQISLDLEQIVDFLENLTIPDTKRLIIKKTFATCLKDRDYTVKAGALYGVIHGMKIEDDTVRSLLLSSIQKELEENDFQEGNRQRFLNAVFLLSELYYHIRFDGQPVTILGGELIKYFRWLLTGEENELEVLAIGLIVNGATLKMDKPVSYKKLSVEIRVALVTRNLSVMSRSWLLLILDMDTNNFTSLPEDLLMCHMNLIGDAHFKKLKRVRPSPVQRSTASARESLPSKQISLVRHPQTPDGSPPGRYSPDNASSSENWDNYEKSDHSKKQLPPSEQRRSNVRRISPERCSPELWDSPDRELALRRQQSSESQQQRESYTQSRTGQGRSIEPSNRLQKQDGRYQRGQHKQQESHKSNQDRWADTPSSGLVHQESRIKKDKRFPAWKNEHDDRFSRDYN